MAICISLTPGQLQVLLDQGYTITSGPYNDEAACSATCITDTGTGTGTGTDEQVPRLWYCLKYPSGEYYGCFPLSSTELRTRLAAGYLQIGGPFLTETPCTNFCSDTGTGTGTGSTDEGLYCLTTSDGDGLACYLNTPESLETLLSLGWTYYGGPYSVDALGQADCEAACTGGWYCMRPPSTGTGTGAENDICLILNAAERQDLVGIGYTVINGPYSAEGECLAMCGSADTGTGTGTCEPQTINFLIDITPCNNPAALCSGFDMNAVFLSPPLVVAPVNVWCLHNDGVEPDHEIAFQDGSLVFAATYDCALAEWVNWECTLDCGSTDGETASCLETVAGVLVSTSPRQYKFTFTTGGNCCNEEPEVSVLITIY